MKGHLKLAIVGFVGAFVCIVPFVFKGYCGEKKLIRNNISEEVQQPPPVEESPQFQPNPWGRESNSTRQKPRNWLRQLPPHRQSKDWLPEAELREQAQLITVKVLSGMSSGSGIIWQKQGEVYQVLTNNHVLIFGQVNQSYKIQTPDSKIYPAYQVKTVKFKDYDLALLAFHSREKYQVASFSFPVNLSAGEEVFAAGFPFEVDKSKEEGFIFSKGQVEMLSDRAFGGGYRIGLTISIKKGMSGGPLLNRQGKVIGINGVHKYPLWGNPYVFADGSTASVEEKKEMQQLSWAIPIPNFLQKR
jgi:serine protease Do